MIGPATVVALAIVTLAVLPDLPITNPPKLVVTSSKLYALVNPVPTDLMTSVPEPLNPLEVTLGTLFSNDKVPALITVAPV